MKIDAKLIGKITGMVKQPVLVGKIIQICVDDLDPEEKSKAVARMYLDKNVAHLRAKVVAPAIAFFVGLSEGTALSISRAIQSELYPTNHPSIEGRPIDGMRTVLEFQYGCFVGFLQGVAESEGYCESAQRQLGHDLIQIVRWDNSEDITSHECYGGISNAVSRIFDKYPFLTTMFLEAMCRCPADWVIGAYAVRICDCFLHKVLGIEKLTLKEKATALKVLHDKARFGLAANKPEKEEEVGV